MTSWLGLSFVLEEFAGFLYAVYEQKIIHLGIQAFKKKHKKTITTNQNNCEQNSTAAV